MSDQGTTIRRRSPEETFALLGDGTRIQILRALQEYDGDTVTFSELRDQVGTRDSGRFNYHLKKLSGSFIRKTDEGYQLTMAGESVVGAMLAGTYTAVAEMEPIDLEDGECLECGGPLRIEYEDESIHIFCRDCEMIHGDFPFPPGTLDQYDREELPAAFNRWINSQFSQAVGGFCPNCAGRVQPSIELDEDDDYIARYDCKQCGQPISASIGATLLFEPTVIAFCRDHGVDLTEQPYWELDWLRQDNVTVTSTDPLELRVRVTVDGAILDVTVDEDLEVVDAVRR